MSRPAVRRPYLLRSWVVGAWAITFGVLAILAFLATLYLGYVAHQPANLSAALAGVFTTASMCLAFGSFKQHAEDTRTVDRCFDNPVESLEEEAARICGTDN